jgi:hypothetical protein
MRWCYDEPTLDDMFADPLIAAVMRRTVWMPMTCGRR